MTNQTTEPIRCSWSATPYSIPYHDNEWGTPVHDDRTLFEFLILEGAQAGLNWETILKKREGYRKAFEAFDPVRVASYSEEDKARLLADAGIIRNRLRVGSAVANARAFLVIQQEFGSFDAYLWAWVGGKPRQNHWNSLSEIPAKTPESDALSKDLSKRGFSFVGSTIMYAFMQAVGLVNDHVITCFRHAQLADDQ